MTALTFMRACRNCEDEFEVTSKNKGQECCSRRCAGLLRHRVLGYQAHPRYNGGLCRRGDGRLVIVCRDGSLMFFYRGVMAAHIGRILQPDEIIHHRNGDHTDDRIENLEIVTRAEHMRMHRADLNRGRGIR